MTKQLANIALLLGFVFILATSGSAQNTKSENKLNIPLVAKFALYQMSDAQLKKVAGKRSIKGDPAGKQLHKLEILTSSSAPTLLHMGTKWPLVYFDPRAEQFQVQYVDTGMKLDLTIDTKDNKSFRVKIRPETSSLQKLIAKGELAAYPITAPFIVESELSGLTMGETLVLSYASGPSASSFLINEGLNPQEDNIVYVLRLERP